MDDPIVARLDELESRLAFQDDMIETLNETITRQDPQMARMELRIKALADKLQDLAESASMPGGSAGHEIPPHY